MVRFLYVAAFVSLPVFANAQTRYVLQGEITDGASLFPEHERPRPPWEEYGDPAEGYPIDYAARLDVWAEDDWRFNFTALAADEQTTHFTAPPLRPTLEFAEESLEIHQTIALGFAEFFDLSLDFQTGLGDWNWEQDCFDCLLAYPLPSASATVTSISVMSYTDGDFNDDGLWGLADIDALMTAIARNTGDVSIDVSGDGKLTDLDRDYWLAEAGPKNGFREAFRPGDANLDGVVNSVDLNRLAANWQTDETTWSGGNFSGSKVDRADLNVLGLNWRRSARLAVPQAAPVPEPAAGSEAMWIAAALLTQFQCVRLVTRRRV